MLFSSSLPLFLVVLGSVSPFASCALYLNKKTATLLYLYLTYIHHLVLSTFPILGHPGSNVDSLRNLNIHHPSLVFVRLDGSLPTLFPGQRRHGCSGRAHP